METKKIFVYVNEGILGTVYIEYIKGKECYSFEYSDFALTHNLRNYLFEKDISFMKGRQYKEDSKLPYKFLEDSSPDRWGKNLIKRKLGENNLFFSDFLLNVSDLSRTGELRYKENIEDEFLSKENKIPPLKEIRTLENIAYNYNNLADSSSLKILLTSGSSLGGSRPKASIIDENGDLYIAKFGNKIDEYDYSKVEYFTYLFAKDIGINMSPSRLIEIDKNRSVFLTKRFDREGEKRFHYVSFMTLLNANEGESNNFTYLDLASVITKHSVEPDSDLKELFLRIAFNLIFHNYDDHLRNHGMLIKDGKIKLSPCFDLNIVFERGNLTLSIDGMNEDTIETLIKNSKEFRLNEEEAQEIVEKIKNAINLKFDYFANKAKFDTSLKKLIKTVLNF